MRGKQNNIQAPAAMRMRLERGSGSMSGGFALFFEGYRVSLLLVRNIQGVRR